MNFFLYQVSIEKLITFMRPPYVDLSVKCSACPLPERVDLEVDVVAAGELCSTGAARPGVRRVVGVAGGGAHHVRRHAEPDLSGQKY